MRTAVASKFRQSAGDGTLRIGEMRGSHPCAWHSAAATCGAAVALSALASLLGDWGRSPQQAGACLTLWSEVPEENWPFLLKILAMSVMGAGDALAMSPRRLPSFSQPWLAMAFGQSPARAVFWPDFASIWRFRQLSETLHRALPLPRGRVPPPGWDDEAAGRERRVGWVGCLHRPAGLCFVDLMGCAASRGRWVTRNSG